MEKVNVEQIMKEIREEIVEKGYKQSDLSFEDVNVPDYQSTNDGMTGKYDANKLNDSLLTANVTWRVDYYKPITDTGIKGFLKKLIRKLIKPIMYRICQNQEQYNASVVQTLNELNKCIKIQQEKIDALQEYIDRERN